MEDDMTMKQFISINDGLVPNDVAANSGDTIPLFGELTGDPTEIIVITQMGRTVYEAYVCHLQYGCILDMSGFKKINVTHNCVIKMRGGIRYTMCCLAEKEYEQVSANWLW